ncbi:MAG: RHS repeat-associated core domain-containing protein [Parafilimonas sp.]
MLPANKHLLPVIGIDVHMIVILGAPVPVPHPFIGLVFDPMDWIPKIGATVNVNSIPRGNSGTSGMLGTKAHIPMGGPFAMAPMIGHDAKNFFGSPRVKAEGSYFSAGGFMLMTCNDIGIPLSLSAGKKFKPVPSLYAPTSATIPIPGGKPVIVGGPYVPDLMGMLMALVMSYGFSALMKVGGALIKKALTALNHGVLKKFKCTQSLGDFLCKHGFEPVNLINGSVLYEGIDFEMPGPIPVKWSRRWYSDSGYRGLLGHGTHLNYDQTLQIFQDDNAIGITLPDGRAAGFPLIVSEYESFYHRFEKLTLTCKDRNTYELFNHKTQLLHTFKRTQRNTYKLSTISNAAGLSLKFYYNADYILNKIIDTAGREILLALDNFNRITKVTAQHKGFKRTMIEYGYNDVGDLTAITDAKEQTTSIVYQNHLMVEKTDRNGQTFYWKYDGLKTGARCVHTWSDGGILEGRIEYHKGFNVVTNSLGEQKTYHYDENDLCVQETDALGNSVFHQYTEYMEPYRDIDEEGNITGYVYDDRGNMIAVQKPDGAAINYLYDGNGKLKMITDAEGKSTVYVNKDGLLKAVVAPDSAVTAYEYNAEGLIKTITNNKGLQTKLQYDDDHNLIKMILPDSVGASWEYDAWGRCVKAVNPEKQAEDFVYDVLDRVVRIKKYDGNKIQLQYNAYDEVLYAEDAHHRVKFEYTPLGSLQSREENGTRIQFNYNTEDRLVSLLNEQNEVYRFKYDARGKIIREIGFDGIARDYVRDRAGKVIRLNRPGNRFTAYEYDMAGRLTRAEYSDGTWEIYGYNKNGQLIEAANENSSVIIERDALGRVIKDNQDEYFVESVYDKLGRRAEVKSSLGASIKLERNKAGFVSSVVANNAAGERWGAQFKYNALGFETERLLPGDIISSFDYDRAGHPLEQKVRNGSSVLRHRSYSWNVNDRLQSMVNNLTRGAVQYGHDDFGNLAWARYEDNFYDYRMPDKAGNFYKTKEQTDRRYGNGGRLFESDGVKYSYDEEGNLISKTSQDGVKWLYKWNGNGMLKQVIRPDGKEVNFEYDALGRRTAKIYNGNITRWVWDGNTPLHEWKYAAKERPKIAIDEYGEVSKNKTEPVDNLITWIFDEGTFKPAAKIENGKQQSIITDYLGTPVEMYGSDGKQTWSVEYDIYGKIRKQYIGGLTDCPFRYQGQYEDEETGLYYNRFRYYDGNDGRYVSQDPIRLSGGLNFYNYVQDPGIYIDGFGLTPFTPRPVTEGSVFRGVKPGQPTFSPDANDLAGMDHMPGISSKPKNNAQTQKFFQKMGADVKEIDVTKLSALEAIQDGKDHVSLRPSQKYLDEKGISMKEALEDWSKGGDEHELSKELAGACK